MKAKIKDKLIAFALRCKSNMKYKTNVWESKLIDCDQSNAQILESGSVRSRRRWHQQRIQMFKPLQRTLRSFSQISQLISTGKKLGGGGGQFSRFVHGLISVLLPTIVTAIVDALLGS